MKRFLIGGMVWMGLMASAFSQINPCAGSSTNCTTNTGAPFTASVLEPSTGWPYICVGEPINVTAMPTTNLAGLTEITQTNESCDVTNIVIPLATNAIISNGWEAIGPSNAYMFAGNGLTASFAPTATGPGTLIFSMSYSTSCGTWSVSMTNTFTAVGVLSLTPTNNTNCFLMSSNATLQIWAIPACTNTGGSNLEIVAVPNPSIPLTNLPPCWFLEGTTTNVTEVNIASPGDYTVICSAGTSSMTNIIVVTADGDLTGWQPGKLRWVCPLPMTATNGNGSGIDSSPAIGPDGTVYVTTAGNTLYAINPTNGAIEWTNSDGVGSRTYSDNLLATSSPSVDSNGVIYIGTDDGRVLAINTNGVTIWTNYPGEEIHSVVAIPGNGALYVNVGSYESPSLFAFNSSGATNWSSTIDTEGDGCSSPSVGSDGTVYSEPSAFLNPMQATMTAFSSNGSPLWTYPFGLLESFPQHSLCPSPALGSDGTLYFAGNDSWVYALNPNGTPKWIYDISDFENNTSGALVTNIESSPAIGSDGTVYFGADDYNLYAVTNGVLKWVFTNAQNILISSPAIAADGTIYIGSLDYNLYAVTNGVLSWVFTNATNYVLSSPAVASDGTVYFTSEDGNLYAVYGSAPLDTNSPWPMFRRNPRHTGTASPSSAGVMTCSPPVIYGSAMGEGENPSQDIVFTLVAYGPSNTSWNVFFSADMVAWTNVDVMNFDANGAGTLPGFVGCPGCYQMTNSDPITTAFFYLSSTNGGDCCSQIMGFYLESIMPGDLIVNPFYGMAPVVIDDLVVNRDPMNSLEALINNQVDDFYLPGLTWVTPNIQIVESSSQGLEPFGSINVNSWNGYAVGWTNQMGNFSHSFLLLPGQAALFLSAEDGPNAIPLTLGLSGVVAPPGLVTNPVFAGTNYLSSILPKAGYLASDLNFTNASLNDQISIWIPDLGDYLVYSCTNSVLQQWDPEEPYLNIAQGFILITTNATQWIQEIPACPAQGSSSCVYSSATNCTGGSGPGLAITSGSPSTFPWSVVGQTIQATASLTAAAPGLLVNIITNMDCTVITNVLLDPTNIVTNSWFSSGPGTNAASGSGLFASFTPTNCGTGTLVFSIVYSNTATCGSGLGATSTVSITNTFAIVGADGLEPTNCSTCTVVSSNATYQAFAVSVTTNTPSDIDVVASSCPGLTGPAFPSFWSLNGLPTNVAYVNTTIPGTYNVVFTVGTSSITNVYYILNSTNTGLSVVITEPQNNSSIP
jgi:outer membrane protein assembly factor BamB